MEQRNAAELRKPFGELSPGVTMKLAIACRGGKNQSCGRTMPLGPWEMLRGSAAAGQKESHVSRRMFWSPA